MSALSCGCDPEDLYLCMLHRLTEVKARPLSIIEYCTEEVSRQGHNVLAVDGLLRVSWMLDAWCCALGRSQRVKGIALDDIRMIGMTIERYANVGGLRNGDVWVGGQACPAAEAVEPMLDALLKEQEDLEPLVFYKRLLVIHPFFDGNGRTGKIILNWLNGTLESNPVFPPDTLWGRRIRNP